MSTTPSSNSDHEDLETAQDPKTNGWQQNEASSTMMMSESFLVPRQKQHQHQHQHQQQQQQQQQEDGTIKESTPLLFDPTRSTTPANNNNNNNSTSTPTPTPTLPRQKIISRFDNSVRESLWLDDLEQNPQYRSEEGGSSIIISSGPMMVNPSLSKVGSSSGSNIFPSSTTTASLSSSHKGWNSLKVHVQNGDLLLEDCADGYSTNSPTTSTTAHENENPFPSGYKNGGGNHQRTGSYLRRKAFEEFHDGMTFSIPQCLLAIGLYLGISIAMFSFVLEPQWTIIDSCYFAVTTFTTLGYGDLLPTHTSSIIFTCIYALLGVACLGVALGVLGNQLIDSREQNVRQAEAVSKYEVMSLFDETRHGLESPTATTTATEATSPVPTSIISSPPTTTRVQSQSQWRQDVWEEGHHFRHKLKLGRFATLLLVTLWLACGIGYSSGWDVLNTVYYLVITGCTIGYGDLTPTTQTQKLMAVAFIPLACLVTGHWLGYVAHRIVDLRSSEFIRKHVQAREELTRDDLDTMDVNGDGVVTRAEFLEFLLVAMNKIDFELVEELQAYFRKLDVTGTGELSRDDLVVVARRKLKNPRRKLQLAAYKQRLLGQAAAGRFRHRHPNLLAKMLHRLPSFLGESRRQNRGPAPAEEEEGQQHPSAWQQTNSIPSFASSSESEGQ